MSGCGICLASRADGEDCTGYRRVVVRAGREWACDECGGKIPKRTLYELASGFNDREHWQTKTCLECAEIAEAFYCGGRWHGGLWDAMEEAIPLLTTACFERLRTPSAKAKLRRAFIETMLDPRNREELLREAKWRMGMSAA